MGILMSSPPPAPSALQCIGTLQIFPSLCIDHMFIPEHDHFCETVAGFSIGIISQGKFSSLFLQCSWNLAAVLFVCLFVFYLATQFMLPQIFLLVIFLHILRDPVQVLLSSPL